MIYELINPSDNITFESDNEKAMIASVLMVCQSGMIGLKRVGQKDQEDIDLIPAGLTFRGEDYVKKWLDEMFPEKTGKFVDDNLFDVMSAMESILYGSVGDRDLFNMACKGKTPAEILEFRHEWNDKKRSSMINHEHNFLTTADQLRKKLELT